MELMKVKCRVCALKGYGLQPHAIITEFTHPEAGKVFVQCLGCGIYGYEDRQNAQLPVSLRSMRRRIRNESPGKYTWRQRTLVLQLPNDARVQRAIDHIQGNGMG